MIGRLAGSLARVNGPCRVLGPPSPVGLRSEGAAVTIAPEAFDPERDDVR